VTDPLLRFRLDYTPLMLKYLSQRDETSLGLAYELGRDAMRASIGLLDVVRVHHEIFLEVLATARDTDEAQRIAGAASALLMDLIASFEMSHRAFTESRSPRHDGDPRSR
jgi:hypothetical protein